MKTRYTLLIAALLLLAGGAFYQWKSTEDDRNCPNGRPHMFRQWKSSGHVYHGKMVSTRPCVYCGYVQSR